MRFTPRLHTLFLLALAQLAGCSCSKTSSASPPATEARATETAATQAPPATPPGPPNVTGLEALLRARLDDAGRFDYAGLHGDARQLAALDAYLDSAATATPDEWPRDAQLAFYLNTYNALVIRAVMARWPIESVQREEGFFSGDTYRVAGREITLDTLENEIIRGERFREPRIHFAVNCASLGCPRLWPTAFTAENLEAELERRARLFIRGTTRVDRDARSVHVSKLFSWFALDFGPAGGPMAFVARYLDPADAEVASDPSTMPEFDDYDWTLNASAPGEAPAPAATVPAR